MRELQLQIACVNEMQFRCDFRAICGRDIAVVVNMFETWCNFEANLDKYDFFTSGCFELDDAENKMSERN